jgi:anti-anti-sigma regulatory factor
VLSSVAMVITRCSYLFCTTSAQLDHDFAVMTGSSPASAGLGWSNLGLSSRQLGSNVIVVDITGELDMATPVQLQAYLVEKTAAGSNRVVKRVLEVTGLMAMFDIHENEDKLLAELMSDGEV